MRKKYKLKCEYCGNEFESTHSDSKTCSRHCANKLRYENNVDKNVFENWSSESAYYFGLIMSDGCLIHNKDRHLIVLTMNDFEILNILHEYTECKRKIYKENSSYSLRYWNEDAGAKIYNRCINK